jgi:hypothetical protein
MAQLQEVFLFSPTQISGCQVWLDGTDPNGTGVLPANGASVSTWVDKSGNARNATAFSTAATFSNSNVVFTGNQMYNTTLTSVLNKQTMFAIASANSTNKMDIVGVQTATVTTGIQLIVQNYSQVVTLFGGTLVANGSAVTPNVRFMYGNIYNAGSDSFVYLNGTQSGTKSGSTTLTGSGTVTIGAYYYVGSDPTPNEWWIGNISEVIVYNNVLSTSQRQQIEGYLAWKWGIQGSLPSNHPFKTYRPLANTPFPTIGIPPMPTITQGTTVFVPTQITGCSLWLDAADRSTLTLSGSSVTQWNDKSGNGRNATGYNTTATFNPNGLNPGYSALEFSATKSMQSPVASGTFSSAVSGFIIYKFTGSVNLTAAYGLFSRTVSPSNGVPNPFDMYSFSNSTYRSLGNGTVFTQSSVSPNYITQTNASQYNFSIQSSATTTWNESVNGTFVTLTTSGGTGAGYGDTGSNVMIGGRLDTAVFFQGVISEVILYNISITTSQRQQIEGYLAWKWGLTANLPNGHPYKRVPIAPFSFRSIPFNGSLNQWIPTQISGCSLWLDAADNNSVVLSGSNVTQWRDKTGTTNVLQINASLQPTFLSSGFNGRPTLRFTAVQGSSYQELATATTSQYDSLTSLYMFCVYRVITPIPAYPGLFSIQNKVSYYLRGLDNANNFGGSNVWTYNGGSFVTNNDTIVTYDQNGFLCLGLEGGFQSTYLNGSFTGAPKAFSFGSGTSLILRIGYSGYNTNDGFNGYISEVLVYKASLSTSQRQQVEGYLAWKWGLQGNLPATHPYKRFPPSP